MLESLIASGQKPGPTFDWNADGSRPYAIARAQFMSVVSTLIDGGNITAGYAHEYVRTDSPVEAVLGDDWTLRGDWRMFGNRFVIASATRGVEYLFVEGDSDNGYLTFEVFSPDGFTVARSTLDTLLGRCELFESDDTVEVRFWAATAHGPISYRRQFDAPAWDEVAGNYPEALSGRLSSVHGWTSPPPSGGRLLLAHGPAGTGKTTAVRTLARAWSAWCDVDVVTDPDEFFGMSAYMIGVLLGAGDENRWRLIVIEDCDELLTADAKTRSGQAVARLLNVCDGLIGQGLRILLYLTTNESVEHFHEAIVRPGRCLQNLYFGRFTIEEANAWRAARDLPPNEELKPTLADLYAEVRDAHRDRASRIADRLRRP